MADYLVKAKDKNGNDFKTVITADSEATAAKFLVNKGFFPISISIKGSHGSLADTLLPFIGRITSKDKVVFARQLATMMNAGLPLVQSLYTLSAQTTNAKFKVVIAKIAADVEGGSSFSSAVTNHPDVFSPLFLAMVRAGESSGTLEKVLTRIADQMEKSHNLLSKIKNAMFYPSFVVGLVMVIMILMTVFVIPQFAGFLTSIGADLPLPTKILLAFSRLMVNFWWVFILAVFALIYAFRQSLSTDKGRTAWDRIKMKTPMVNNLLKMIYMSRFARTLGTLIGAGVPVLDSMSITADSINNRVYRAELLKASDEIKKGVALSIPLEESIYFPPLVHQMIAIGEQTGELDNILHKLADFYDEEVDNITRNLSSLIEPILLVVVGIMVLGFILTILLPVGSIVLKFATGGTGGVRI